MDVTVAATPCARQLLAAVAARDEPHLSCLLTRAKQADLGATVPLSLFHAAAAAGDAHAVHLLVEAGAPSAAAEQPANPLPEELDALGLGGTTWSHAASALAVAVSNGHTAVVAALLAAGVSPNIGGQFAPLVLALQAPAAAAEPIARLLLAAGADIRACSSSEVMAASQSSRGMARLVMDAVRQLNWPEMAAGRFPLCGIIYGEDERNLLLSAALTDQPAVLEAVCRDCWEHLTLATARQLLCVAAEHGCLQVLQLALQPAAAGSLFPAAVRWLRAVPAAAEYIMLEAAHTDRPAAARLLMREGYPATNEAVAMAMRQFSAATLEQLLAGGTPEAPTTQDFVVGVHVLYLPSSDHCPYTCPVLAALHARTTQEWEACEGPRAFEGLPPGAYDYFASHPPAVHPADALLLPLLERLLAAGCRPTVYRDVPVRLEGGPLSTWKELDPLVHDSALDLEGKHRWLALALEHPPWSPQQHARFPPSFRRAVATVLLAAHRGCFSRLPGELLQQILGLAAWPLSAWAPLDVPVLAAAPLGGACLPAE